MASMFKQMFLVGLVFVLIIVLAISSTILYFTNSKPKQIELVDTTKVVELNKIDTPTLTIKPIETVKVFDTVKVYVYPKPVEPKIEEPKLPSSPIVTDTTNLN